jgi:2-desacetyl-2-hydroxyethyl bacteriochlorophyllide A dehydrogenase
MAYLVQLTEPRAVSIREYPVPDAPGADEVLIRTLYSGISAGTELATYRGTNPYLEKRWDPELGLFLPGQATFDYPVDVWGYSEVGVVEQVGSGVTDVAVDDVVWGIWGHRSHTVLPAQRVAGHQVDGSLDPIVGTFDRVGAVALNAVLASDARIGETVAVFGQGVIGLLATQLLTSMGCRVLAVDTMPTRLELAETLGAVPVSALDDDVALTVKELTGGTGVDRVIELTGAYPALHQAIRVGGVGGTVIAAGFYQGPATALALGEEFHHNRVTLVCSQIGALPPNLQDRWSRERLHETVMTLCASGRLDPRPLISHVLPAAAAADAYRLIDQPPADLLQVVLDFREEAA